MYTYNKNYLIRDVSEWEKKREIWWTELSHVIFSSDLEYSLADE